MKTIQEVIADSNGHKIYVENVRAALDITTVEAQILCSVAVDDGLLIEGIEICMPDNSVAFETLGNSIPLTVTGNMEIDGEYEEVALSPENLRRRTFYQATERAKKNSAVEDYRKKLGLYCRLQERHYREGYMEVTRELGKPQDIARAEREIIESDKMHSRETWPEGNPECGCCYWHA